MSTLSNPHTYALVMAGGAGTRLWPMSRSGLPKQFQYLLGSQTPFQHMIGLITQVIPLERIYVMATPDFKPMILEQVPELPEQNILMEPARRDTGPAITLGMLQIQHHDAEATVGIFWSDHRIERPDAFKHAITAAFATSEDHPDYLVIVGANPTRPDTTLGYIQISDELGTYDSVRVFAAQKFIEKPDLSTALQFQSSWEYLWNVGYSVMSVSSFFKSFHDVQPTLTGTLEKLNENLKNNEPEALAATYAEMPKISIDYLFTQKLSKLAAVPADMGWSDIGSWQILHEVLSVNEAGNMVTKGDVTSLESSKSLVYAKDRPIALIGMQNVIVVDTGDAILVMNRTAPSALVKELTTQFTTSKPELL